MRFWHLSVFLLIISIVAIFYFMPLKNPFAVKSMEMPLGSSEEKSSPTNYINESQIEIQDNKIIIHINRARIGRFANTSSMMPVINENANSIEIIPSTPEQIYVGDIITFEQASQDSILIVHRVIETGYDENGWYAITKGDNSQATDGKIRFEQVRYITIGILY
jgi:hypothetical protein